MKKKLSYRDKLLELAYIYNVKEIQDYTKNRKNLTTGQIELILKKNKIVIPKEFNTSFIKENFFKPITKLKTSIYDFREEKIKDKNRFFRKIENYKYDTSRKVNRGILYFWKSLRASSISFCTISKFVYSVLSLSLIDCILFLRKSTSLLGSAVKPITHFFSGLFFNISGTEFSLTSGIFDIFIPLFAR